MRCGVIIRSKFGVFNSYYLVQVFLKHCLSKYYKIGFSALSYWEQIARKHFDGYHLVQVGQFLDPKLGPDKNSYLDQIITIYNVFLFFALKMCWNSGFEHQPIFAKKGAQQNDNFSHFAKHRLYTYIYIYADESDNGTLLTQKRVEQRDAPPFRTIKIVVSPFFGGGGN